MRDKPIKCSPSSEKVKFSVSFAKDKAEVNCLWHTASSDVREIIKVLETVWTDRANGLGFFRVQFVLTVAIETSVKCLRFSNVNIYI